MASARSPIVRTALFVAGVLVIAVSPLVGILPGPGGIFVFAAGLVLVLRTSAWAQRAFCRAKRRWPRFGHYADMALRRRSARRRRLREGAAEIARAEAELPGLRNGTR
ncbi:MULTISPECIES: hypothetical protein [unclassified Sphingomonas]|uniref:hypothetical protein n=1 Tax=Sphingomonas TaxID=13687 RepID=UPI000AACA229|nr:MULTISPECIES: hypothetical protein [unclassified Sphingomonas]